MVCKLYALKMTADLICALVFVWEFGLKLCEQTENNKKQKCIYLVNTKYII